MKWKQVKVKDICTLVRGSSPRPKGDSRYYGGNVPRLMIEDITRDGMYATPMTDSLTEAGALQSRPMKKGDLVMTVSGRTGVPAILDVDACIHDGFVGFRDLSPSVATEYLYHYFSFLSETTASKSVGAIFKNLTTDQIKDLNVPLPPLPIQQQIADTLDKADALRRKDQELLQKYDELAQSIFYDMFGDPVRNERGWNVKPIEEVTSFIDYRGKTPERVDGLGIPLITAKNVKFGYFDYTDKDFITPELYDQIMTRGFPEPNDVLFTTEGATLGNVCRIPSLGKFAVGQRLISMKGEGVTSEYLHYIMCSDFFQNQVFRRATGSAAKGIRSAELKKLVIPVPDYKLQLLFSKLIAVLDRQRELLFRSVDQSTIVFQTLINSVFT